MLIYASPARNHVRRTRTEFPRSAYARCADEGPRQPSVTAHNLIFVDVSDDLKERPTEKAKANTIASGRWFYAVVATHFSPAPAPAISLLCAALRRMHFRHFRPKWGKQTYAGDAHTLTYST